MKKNYGIDMQGPFRVQRIISLPSWTSNDVGRELYTANDKKYYGDSTGWVEARVDKIWTHQDSAPTGWSIIAGTTDSLLACKGGSNAYNISGGGQAGTWTPPGHTHTGPSHTHTGGSHALSVSEMPSHDHDCEAYAGTSPNAGLYFQPSNLGGGGLLTSSRGGGGTHSHGSTSAAGTGATSSNGTPNTYRPIANVGIVIERN